MDTRRITERIGVGLGVLAVSAAAVGVSATGASAQSASSGSGSSSITSGRLLPADWVAQASPYVVTRGYFAYLAPDFAKVSSPQEYSAVKQMIQIYDAAPMAAKTVGVSTSVQVSAKYASKGGIIKPDLFVGGGCSGWESFHFEGWDGFQWYMNQCFATGLVDELIGGAALYYVIAAALGPLGVSSAIAGVSGALASAMGGAAGYIAETQNMCGSRNIWVGLHYWVSPSHGCA